jgi:hypothetical protein
MIDVNYGIIPICLFLLWKMMVYTAANQMRGGGKWSSKKVFSSLPVKLQSFIKHDIVQNASKVCEVVSKTKLKEQQQQQGKKVKINNSESSSAVTTSITSSRVGKITNHPSSLVLTKLQSEHRAVMSISNVLSQLYSLVDYSHSELNTLTSFMATIGFLLVCLLCENNRSAIVVTTAFIWFSPFADRFRYLLSCFIRFESQRAFLYKSMQFTEVTESSSL